jgi:hypothetical protein
MMMAAAVPAIAARTDVIVLRNGDRLTGEVIELRQGKLKVKTDDMSTISIEWDKIAGVTTAERYDVTMRDGTRLLGRLAAGPARSVQVVADGGTSTSVAMADIVSMAAIKSGFLGRIDGSVDLGGSYTKASGVAQVSLDAEARRHHSDDRRGDSVHLQRASERSARMTVELSRQGLGEDDHGSSPDAILVLLEGASDQRRHPEHVEVARRCLDDVCPSWSAHPREVHLPPAEHSHLVEGAGPSAPVDVVGIAHRHLRKRRGGLADEHQALGSRVRHRLEQRRVEHAAQTVPKAPVKARP